MGPICRTSIITILCRQRNKERRSNVSYQEKKEQGVTEEEEEENKKPHSYRKWVFPHTWILFTISVLLMIIDYSTSGLQFINTISTYMFVALSCSCCMSSKVVVIFEWVSKVVVIVNLRKKLVIFNIIPLFQYIFTIAVKHFI